MTAARPAGDEVAAEGAVPAQVLRLLDPDVDASALSLLFPVFLLLAALVATLAARRPAHPEAETAVLASLAGRFAPIGMIAGTSGLEEAELLSALERLRSRPEGGADVDETNPASPDGEWSVTISAERFFAEGTDTPRPERQVLLYRLAQAAGALAPEGATLEIVIGSGPLDGNAPARLAEICRRLADFGAPAAAFRLRPRRDDGLDAVTLALTGVRRRA